MCVQFSFEKWRAQKRLQKNVLCFNKCRKSFVVSREENSYSFSKYKNETGLKATRFECNYYHYFKTKKRYSHTRTQNGGKPIIWPDTDPWPPTHWPVVHGGHLLVLAALRRLHVGARPLHLQPVTRPHLAHLHLHTLALSLRTDEPLGELVPHDVSDAFPLAVQPVEWLRRRDTLSILRFNSCYFLI